MPDTTNCLFCHNQSSATVRQGWAGPMQVNAGNMFGNRYAVNNGSCYACHTRNSTEPPDFHSNELVKGGGSGCLGCHNNSDPQNFTALDGTPLHYIDGANFSRSVHVNLNSNNASGYGINASCWACHSSNGFVVANNTHPDKRDTPYVCPDCHLAGGTRAGIYNAAIIYNHYKNGTGIRALDQRTNDVSSCTGCHENVSTMITGNNDSDTGSFASDGVGINGGNTSFYHYGANRSNFNRAAGSYDYCIYCHRNTTGEFNIVFQDAANMNISNHSMRYNSSNPSCSTSYCHNSTNSDLHGIQIKKPNINITLHNSSYCLECHGMNSTGNGTNYTGAVTSYKEKHNNSVSCTECHTGPDKKNIHPIKYLQPDGSFAAGNQTGVNCADCHQQSTVDPLLLLLPPKVPDPMHHSDNTSNGTAWNTTGYWSPNSTLTSCIYCHNDTRHNASAPLGRPIYWKGDNVINSTINSSSWCSSCHYRGYSSGGNNYADMTSSFILANLSVPPEITNGTYAPYNLSRYYNHSLTNYSDSTCWLCHGTNISSNAGISAFLHNITWGSCTSCHYSFDAMNSTDHPERFVDSEMYNASLHRSLTCQNCHTSGHRNIGARKACEDCHVVQANPVTDKDRHNITASPGTNMYNGNSAVNITDCTTCHNSVLYNNSINTYGYGKPKDCDYCHTYPDKYYP
jgi:Cytochrome c3